MVALSSAVAACRESPKGKPPESPEKPVVCDLEKWRAEMPKLERQCAEGVAKSCFSLGTTIHGRPWCGPVTPQPERIRAWNLFEKACLLGDVDGCYALENGAGTRWKTDATPAELETACGANVGYACYLRGKQISEGFWSSVSPESTEETIRDGLRAAILDAHPWHVRACARGIQEGCFEEAFRLNFGRDATRAVALFEQACRDWRTTRRPVIGSSLSCTWLANAYEEGLGVPRDWKRSRTMRHEVCRLDKLCDDLFLVTSRRDREWLWALEYTATVAANGFALLLRRRRPTAKWQFPLLLTIATLAGISIAWEFWYYFTGSNLQSHAWWGMAALPVVFPLLTWSRARNSTSPERT